LQRTPVNFDELVGPLQGLPAGKACAIIRAMIPVISRHWADRFAERLEGDWPAAGADPGAGR